MDKKIKILGGVSLILIGAAFYGGMLYGKSGAAATANANRRNFQGMGGNFQGAGRPAGGGGGGGNVSGDILSVSDKILTVKMRDGSSKIIVYSTSTPIREITQIDITRSELQVGKAITVLGTTNSDGSVTAQSIQLRASSTPFGGVGRGQNRPDQQ
jgi:hypothetical protein